MRIEAADGDLRVGDAEPLERHVGRADRARHVLARDQRNRLAHAPVQRAVRDPHVAEAQHHVDAVLVGAGLPRDERRMAVELDAGLRDRGLVLRRGHHRIDLARHRGLDRGGAERDRGAAADRADDAEAAAKRASGCGQASDVDDLRSARTSMPARYLAWRSSKAGVADQDRLAGRAHGGIERGLERDLRPDAGRIADGNRDLDLAAHAHSHGISEAWITSGTPSLPTERMARSTSFKPNRCVVISSSGKRFEAICSSASSQAL